MMEEPRIRAATAADVSAIAEIVDQAYHHYIGRIGKPAGPMLDDYAARVSEGWYGCSRKGPRWPPSSCSYLRRIICSSIHRRLPHTPGLRIGPPAARVRRGRSGATRL